MDFRFVIDVTVERSQGKFASREEIAEQIQEALEQADPGQLQGGNDGEYETTNWSVVDTSEESKPAKKPRVKPHGAAPSTDA